MFLRPLARRVASAFFALCLGYATHALSKHVIDGAAMPREIIPSLKVHELVKFHSETDPKSRALYSTGFVVAMNPAKYASLPHDLKRVIDANSGADFSAMAGKMWDEAAAQSNIGNIPART